MKLGFCSRSGDIIEPLLRPQWWVDCADIAKKMINVVKTRELTIIPEAYEANWFYWLENIRDWCISRQLWWGHRIPAYLARKKGTEGKWDLNSKDWIVRFSREEALEEASKMLNLPVD